MNKKKLLKIVPIVAASMVMITSKSFATEEELIIDEVPIDTPVQVVEEVNLDTVAPIFDISNVQSRYIVKKEEEKRDFDVSEILSNLKATDDVDGENVEIALVENNVDLTLTGEYHVVFSATDKSGNVSYSFVSVIVDGIAPVFEENIESLYYINSAGIILDSNYNVVESLPKTLKATDSVGAFKGIGVCITTDSEGNIVFVETLENTPASEVIQANDILVGIDGEDVRGQTPDFVATKIRGEAGTEVQLDIIRNGENISLTIQRTVVKMYEDIDYEAEPTVEIESIDFKQNGVIEITYKATDAVGNSSEFVITVIVDTTDPELYIEDKKSDEEESDSEVTTSDPPTEEEVISEDEEVVEKEIIQEKIDEEIVDEEEKDEITEEVADNEETENEEEDIVEENEIIQEVESIEETEEETVVEEENKEEVNN